MLYQKRQTIDQILPSNSIINLASADFQPRIAIVHNISGAIKYNEDFLYGISRFDSIKYLIKKNYL